MTRLKRLTALTTGPVSDNPLLIFQYRNIYLIKIAHSAAENLTAAFSFVAIVMATLRAPPFIHR